MGALSLIGGLLGAAGTVAAGNAERKDANFQAQQLDMQAKEQRASSEREAAQSKQEAILANSRAQALAASSGGGAGDDAPTIVKLMSGIAGQGQLNADTQIYTGFNRAAGLEDQAGAKRRSGRASFLGSVIGGFGQAASSFGKAATSGTFG